ncbi:MAG: polysaccharide deacetylase family protein [Clostridiales bacterium]|jgi:peptidoglycan/xylan/chitin deacetylase (PgdA/CDA1 family)|nr:polysaccharide deacetylase family protein [Clostridiales bacterium]
MKKFTVLMCALAVCLLAACSPEAPAAATTSRNPQTPPAEADLSEEAKAPPAPPEPEKSPEDAAKEAGAYEVGQIMVLMYHGLEDADAPSNSYRRTLKDFRADLRTLYDEGYRTLSMSDYISDNITTPAGKTPVVLTFDDGLPSCLTLEKGTDGSLAPKADCAVGIMNEFYEAHPDFGRNAIFYVNAHPFDEGAGTSADGLRYLAENGYEIGNHTFNHDQLDKLSREKLLAEITDVEKLVREALPDYKMTSLSYPFGIRPKEDLRGLIEKGEYDGVSYEYRAAVRVGDSGTASAPNRKDFDPMNLPRVRASDDDPAGTDLGGMFRRFREHPEYRYISDGDPATVALPEEFADNLDEASLGGKTAVLYTAN